MFGLLTLMKCWWIRDSSIFSCQRAAAGCINTFQWWYSVSANFLVFSRFTIQCNTERDKWLRLTSVGIGKFQIGHRNRNKDTLLILKEGGAFVPRKWDNIDDLGGFNVCCCVHCCCVHLCCFLYCCCHYRNCSRCWCWIGHCWGCCCWYMCHGYIAGNTCNVAIANIYQLLLK